MAGSRAGGVATGRRRAGVPQRYGQRAGRADTACGDPAGRAGRRVLRRALVELCHHRPVGEAGRDQFAHDEADDLQAVGRMGQSRRFHAAVGDGDGAGRRAHCRSGATAARDHHAGDVGSAGLRRAGLLRVSVAQLESVRTPAAACGRGHGPQPAVAGHRSRAASADAVFRLCRPVGRFQLCRRGSGDTAGHTRFCARHAAVDPGRLGLPDAGDRGGQLLGLLRAWLGRVLVLGSGRERLAHAMAGGDGTAAFGKRPGQP